MADNNNKEISDNKKEVIKKRSNGRRKIPIEKITDPTRKHVTFSKRRLGLFKKASELCALCGVEMTILTFSERGKLFCFGHPNSDNVIHRYLSCCGSCCPKEQDEHEFNMTVKEQNRESEEIKKKVDEKKRLTEHYEAEKKRLVGNDEKNQDTNDKCKEGCWFWWEEATVDEMGLYELEQFKTCLMELRNNVAKKADEFSNEQCSF